MKHQRAQNRIVTPPLNGASNSPQQRDKDRATIPARKAELSSLGTETSNDLEPEAVLRSIHNNWRKYLKKTIRQNPLIHTKESTKAFSRSSIAYRPKGIFVGLGLCSGNRISQALPLDAVGYLLTAEELRRNLRAKRLMVLIADVHAIKSGVSPSLVAQRAHHVRSILERLRSRGSFSKLQVLTASTLHKKPAYRSILEAVRERSSLFDHAYFQREAADIEYIRRQCVSLVKVGWTLGGPNGKRDERAFDGCYEKWVGDRVAFVYTKPGRVLDDAHPRGVPYTETNPSRRVCVTPEENISQKLSKTNSWASPQVIKAARNHLKSVCRLYSKLVEPLEGTLEERVHQIIQSLAG